MRNKTMMFCLILGLCELFVLNCPAQQPIRVSAIKAKLFYESTGEFSGNVLTEKGFDLWNTNFDSTYSTFVIVEIENVPSEPPETPRRIELTARYVPFYREKGARVVRQIEAVRNGSVNGKAYAGFWLKDTGCNPVYLSARFVRQKRRVSETLKFGCGE